MRKMNWTVCGCLCYLVFGFHGLAFGQKVQILDAITEAPIPGVFISNRTYSVFTDVLGEGDISHFTTSDTLYFQHVSYSMVSISFMALKQQDFRLKMREKLLKLNPVVISANKWEEDSREVPSQVVSITRKEVAAYQPQTTADFLQASGKVFVQKSQLGGGSPMIRGFSANRLLIVVDGVRMNNAIFRSGNLQNIIAVDANSLERAEVIFGPSSVIYGSDALGGVLHLHTKSPSFSGNKKGKMKTHAALRFASANQERTVHVDMQTGMRKWAFLTSLNYSDYADLRMGKNGEHAIPREFIADRINGRDTLVPNPDPYLQNPTGFGQFNLLQKVRFMPNHSWEVKYAFQYSRTTDVPRYDRLIETRDGQPRVAEWFYGPQQWMIHSLGAKVLSPNKWFSQGKLNVAYQFFEESRNDRTWQSSNLRTRIESVHAISLNADFEKKISSENTLYYGAEWIRNLVGSDGYQMHINTGEKSQVLSRYPDGSTWSSYGVYANMKSKISPKLILVSGLRYNIVSLEADFDQGFFVFPFEEIRQNNDALNGSVGLAFKPREAWQINLNVATGFRAPNIDDIGKVFDSEPGNVLVPNPDLRSEYAYTGELAIARNWGEKAKVELVGFSTLLKNAMVRRDFQFNGSDSIVYDGTLSRVQAIVNAEEAHIFGLQGSLYWQPFSNVDVSTTMTWMRGETNLGEPIRHVAPFFGKSEIMYKRNKWRFLAHVQFNGAIPFDRLAPSERNKAYLYATDRQGRPYSPSWWTFNASAQYQVFKEAYLSVSIDNVFDTYYRMYASGIASPGRNLVLSFQGNF